MRGRTPLHAVILLLAAGTLLRLAITGDYTRYVRVAARPYLISAGVAIGALAIASLWQVLRGRTSGEHLHGRFDVAWLLVLPLAAVLLLAPPAVGAYQASRTGSALPPAPSAPYPPLPASDPVQISVVDYASRAVFDAGKTLAGRHVRMTGFLTRATDGGWYLTRMVVTCCAADAQPIKVGLDGSIPSDATSDRWISVEGTYSIRTAKDRVNGATIPYLAVSAATMTVQPANPYES